MGASCFSACYKPRKPVTDREKQMRRKYLYELIVPDQRTHPFVLIFRFRHAKPPQRRSELPFLSVEHRAVTKPLVGIALIVNLSLRFGLTNRQIY